MSVFLRTVSLGLLALFLLVLLAASAQAQWVQNPANEHWYRLTEFRYYGVHDESDNVLFPDWLQAATEARSYSPLANLVTINDQAENDWLVETFGNQTGFWIGFTDHSFYSSEGNWAWVSGEPVTFTNWDTGQPDNYLQGEDCAHLNHFGSPYWNDLGNDDSHGAGIFTPFHGIVEISGELVANEVTGWDGVKAVFK